MVEGLKRAIEIIEAEMVYASSVNPIMALGMDQVRQLIKKEIESEEK